MSSLGSWDFEIFSPTPLDVNIYLISTALRKDRRLLELHYTGCNCNCEVLNNKLWMSDRIYAGKAAWKPSILPGTTRQVYPWENRRDGFMYFHETGISHFLQHVNDYFTKFLNFSFHNKIFISLQKHRPLSEQ